MKDVELHATLEPWVRARQGLERFPALERDNVIDGVRQRQGALHAAHEHECRVLVALRGRDENTVGELLTEAGVPPHLHAPLLARRRNRQEEDVRQERPGQQVHYGVLYLPFGGFFLHQAETQDALHLPTPGIMDVRPLLDDLSQHLLPMFQFIASHQPLSEIRGAIPLCFRSLEEKGWPAAPFVTWSPSQLAGIHHFLPGSMQGGLLSLPVSAPDEVRLGVLLEQIQLVSATIASDLSKFSRYLAPAQPRLEACEDLAGGMSELWSRWVFALTSRDQGQAEFSFERGDTQRPHRFRGAIRVKDETGQVARMFIHNVTFQREETLSRIVAPWLTTRASHIPWRMSVSHMASFEDPRLASPVPFW